VLYALSYTAALADEGEIAAAVEVARAHDPANADDRRRNGRRAGKLAGRGRPLTEENLRHHIYELEQDPRVQAKFVEPKKV
jgi:hypothetical protein